MAFKGILVLIGGAVTGALFSWSRVKRNHLLATHPRPSHDHASPEKLASEPDLRQMNPVVVTGSITIESDAVPGTICKLQCRSRISLRFIRATKNKIKEAERRKTLFRNHRSLACCGARPFGTRTPSGVPPRFLPEGLMHPNGSASGQASRGKHQ
jgi:hypothetical protein